jgi:hypothetical protein
VLSGGLCGSALACRFGDGLGTRAIAVFLFADLSPLSGDQNQGETHATQDGTVEPSDDQREQFLELESMRKRPCSRQCRGSFRNSR